MNIYLELGKKKVFACAEAWPGWCRSGKDEAESLQNLFDYRSRYAGALCLGDIDFDQPARISEFHLTARYQGNATTEFGGLGVIPDCDWQPMDRSAWELYVGILAACWKALDQAVQLAAGRELRKGPRGGGRDINRMMVHVFEAEKAYLRSIGWKLPLPGPVTGTPDSDWMRGEILAALEAGWNGELPERGPRGGVHWPLRYFFRREAWHVLDHAWEIEDRII